MAAADSSATRTIGAMRPRAERAPVANSNESPGRKGVTTNPVSANTIRKITAYAHVPTCAKSRSRWRSRCSGRSTSDCVIRRGGREDSGEARPWCPSWGLDPPQARVPEYPQLPPLLRVFPAASFRFRSGVVWRDGLRPPLRIYVHHREEGSARVAADAREGVLSEDPHSDFHRRPSHVVQARLVGDDFPHADGSEERQRVDRRRHDGTSAEAKGKQGSD